MSSRQIAFAVFGLLAAVALPSVAAFAEDSLWTSDRFYDARVGGYVTVDGKPVDAGPGHPMMK